MDYEGLYAILPKSHCLWTVQDTQQWLQFIGLHSLRIKFQQSSVDGSILDCLNEQDLVQQLNVTSKIMLKKLTNWIQNGLPAFDRYVKITQNEAEQQLKAQTNKLNTFHNNRSLIKDEKIKQSLKPRDLSSTEYTKGHQLNELIIRSVEHNSTTSYSLKENSAQIGRQANNDIVIMDEFVSRHHAEIIYQNEKYYIQDCGSSSGTFIKVLEKLQLKSGMIIEMGSNQFQININSKNNCAVLVVDGPNLQFYTELRDQQFYSFGRKENNFVSFIDDQHMSGIHSKIFKIKGKWFIEDIGTTNGTWLRLSRQGQQSEPYLLEDKCQFKLSSNLSYQCILNSNNRKTHKAVQQKCYFCRKQDRNTMIGPCKHVIGCYQCLKMQKDCPICQASISSIVRIFTA